MYAEYVGVSRVPSNSMVHLRFLYYIGHSWNIPNFQTHSHVNVEYMPWIRVGTRGASSVNVNSD